jgi:hypothetical protein
MQFSLLGVLNNFDTTIYYPQSRDRAKKGNGSEIGDYHNWDAKGYQDIACDKAKRLRCIFTRIQFVGFRRRWTQYRRNDMSEITETKLEPGELAAKKGKTVICRIIGPMVGVYYPYRKTSDLYVVGPGSPCAGISHCCQCDKNFETVNFLEHVQFHNQRKKKYPEFIIDETLVLKTPKPAHPPCDKDIILPRVPV